MPLLTNVFTGLKALFQRSTIDRELNEELDSYLDASAADKQRQGLSPEAARRAAYVEVGSRLAVKQKVWDSHWESSLDNLLADIRLAIRQLIKSPGFTAIALLSLALGIGANTAIFTLIHQVLLRDLPVGSPEQLVHFGDGTSAGVAGGIDIGGFGLFPWSFTRQVQANPGPFEGIASYGSFSAQVNVRLPSSGLANAPTVLAPASLVSGNYFHVLQAPVLIGRAITDADDATPGGGAVVVLSDHFWQQSLSSDPSVLGKTLTINGTPFSIIGVMPKAFQGLKLELEPTDLWTPVSMQTVILQHPSFLTPTGPYFLHLFGRLHGDASSKPVLSRAQDWLNQQVRDAVRSNEGSTIAPSRLQEIARITVSLAPTAQGVSSVRSQYGDSLKILMVVVALVLLIACANLANFLLARAATRQREVATRLALGSSRGRIIRQSLIETLLLSLTGGALGLGIAFLVTRALIAFVSQGKSTLVMDPTPDLVILLFTLGSCLLTAALFGLAPALASVRTGSAQVLSSNARTVQGSASRSARLWPQALVAVQVMLSLLLLIGAGLFLRTLRNLQNQDYGFERTHLLLADINEQLAGYKPHQIPGLHRVLLERIEALPGVRSAALAGAAPISYGNWSSNISFSGYTPAPKENTNSILNRVTGKYFETAGIQIVAGRPITPADSETTAKVAVVNQTLANHFFPKGDALGRSLTIGIDSAKGPWQIVGIARDTVSGSPRDTERTKMTYIPIMQLELLLPRDPGSSNSAAPEENEDRFAHVLLIRTTGNPTDMIADLRAAVAQVDPNLTLLNVMPIQEHLSNFVSHEELVSTLTAFFAGLALLLVSIGLYGIMSYSVICRTNEIGIRLALGSQTSTVLWMILRECLLLLVVGVVIGLPLSWLATRSIHEQLYGISALDPATFLSAIVVVTCMTLFAGWLPARRATRVDPMIALRCD